MPAAKLKEFLNSHNVKFVSISHSLAYTAQEIASLTHIPGKALAKTVMAYAGDKLVMAVVPASMRVSLSRLRKLTGATTATLATEQEFRSAFPDCETGAMPPFGNLYNIPVYVDEALRKDEIIFNAGSHHELVKMSYADFERLVKPTTGPLASEMYDFAAYQ